MSKQCDSHALAQLCIKTRMCGNTLVSDVLCNINCHSNTLCRLNYSWKLSSILLLSVLLKLSEIGAPAANSYSSDGLQTTCSCDSGCQGFLISCSSQHHRCIQEIGSVTATFSALCGTLILGLERWGKQAEEFG
jgi:hypothetical protein